MAFILHCDGCYAAEDSLIEEEELPPQGAPTATDEAPLRVKVTRDCIVFGCKRDLCNRCIAKINTVLQIPIDTPAIPEERKMPIQYSEHPH